MAAFPLDQWFDLSKPISRDDRGLCEAQMTLLRSLLTAPRLSRARRAPGWGIAGVVG
jgi:hypothetical protein